MEEASTQHSELSLPTSRSPLPLSRDQLQVINSLTGDLSVVNEPVCQPKLIHSRQGKSDYLDKLWYRSYVVWTWSDLDLPQSREKCTFLDQTSSHSQLHSALQAADNFGNKQLAVCPWRRFTSYQRGFINSCASDLTRLVLLACWWIWVGHPQNVARGQTSLV